MGTSILSISNKMQRYTAYLYLETALHISGGTSTHHQERRSARPRPTALLPPRSYGKPETATAVVVAPDDGHEDARNLLSCI
jgi:hypothetical protein